MLAILQARCSSSRLSGKVLKPILGEPMLARQIERLQRSRHISHLVVATSDESTDRPLTKLCQRLGLDCFCGSLNDVLDRFYNAATPYRPEQLLRLTGDCPLADPAVIDNTVDFHLAGKYDYSSNTLQPTFPDGLDVEVFRFSCLSDAWKEAALNSEREHVTPFIYSRPERYRIGHYKQTENFSWLRWTVDQPEDFAMVEIIYNALYPDNPDFTTADILAFLDGHPEIAHMNANIVRNEGYLHSLVNDHPTNSRINP